jgi:hypothetical protein
MGNISTGVANTLKSAKKIYKKCIVKISELSIYALKILLTFLDAHLS